MESPASQSDLEADIWYRLIRPDLDDLSTELARFFLRLTFDQNDLG